MLKRALINMKISIMKLYLAIPQVISFFFNIFIGSLYFFTQIDLAKFNLIVQDLIGYNIKAQDSSLFPCQLHSNSRLTSDKSNCSAK